MRFATLLLFSIAAFAQTKAPAPAPKIDKAKIDAYLRHLELWIPQVTVTMDDPTPAPEMPGYNNLIVHLAYNKASTDIHYYISQDGTRLFKGDSYNLSQSPFQSTLDKLKLDLVPSFGDAKAPVTIAVFGDFECPYCKEEATVLRNNVMTTFPGKVRVYFKDFPLMSIHPWAKPAAIAGKCVFHQNPDTFWKFHDWIYDKQMEITPDNLNAKVLEWAGQNSLDSLQLGRCMDNKTTEPEIDKSVAEGRALGVDGTPTLFLNGRKITDNMAQWQTLQQLITLEVDHQTKVAEEAEKCCTVSVPTVGSRNSVIRFLVFAVALAPAFAASGVDAQTYLDDIKYLSSPQLKGRATPSPELEKAASYIVKQFKSFGLKPPSDEGYEQPYEVHAAAKMGPNNHLSFEESGKKTTLKLASDYSPFRFSSPGSVKGDVVFAGYGITASDLHYDDYAGIDVRDKIVLILRHEPQENDEHSVFGGKELTEHATFAIKAANAKAHGAKGVIIVNDVFTHPDAKDSLAGFTESSGPTDAGVFFAQVKEPYAEEWLKDEGYDLATIAREIDKDLKPHSFPLAKLSVDLSVDLQRETKTVHNVLGYLPGETSEYVVIGAHYDHLGLGDEHSLAPSQMGVIHPGADDNASGTAGVIELARTLSKQPKQKRGILFMTYSGEELGLLGSAWYVGHPVLPLKDAVAMINLDMIGRIRDGKVYVNGLGTGDSLLKLLQSIPPPSPLKLDLSEKLGYAGSDHLSFTLHQVPVVFFFSGLHADYHKPSDTWDKIDSADAAKLLDYVATVATTLESEPGRPQYVRLSEPETSGGGGSGASAGGYAPNFGSVPDFDEPPKGVRFADVRDGTPAAKAGLKAGDILIEFDGKEIGNLYDFTYVLRAHKPGDNVLVKVLRGGQTVEAKVLLTERR